MIVPAEAMQKLMELERLAIEAAQRRDEAVQLVMLAIGAPPGARLVLQPDGTGQVQPPS
jgi:hypothetical protein